MSEDECIGIGETGCKEVKWKGIVVLWKYSGENEEKMERNSILWKVWNKSKRELQYINNQLVEQTDVKNDEKWDR